MIWLVVLGFVLIMLIESLDGPRPGRKRQTAIKPSDFLSRHTKTPWGCSAPSRPKTDAGPPAAGRVGSLP